MLEVIFVGFLIGTLLMCNIFPDGNNFWQWIKQTLERMKL